MQLHHTSSLTINFAKGLHSLAMAMFLIFLKKDANKLTICTSVCAHVLDLHYTQVFDHIKFVIVVQRFYQSEISMLIQIKCFIFTGVTKMYITLGSIT